MAIVRVVGQGALGDDYARVNIRSRFSPFAQAYSGLGGWDFRNGRLESPELRWVEESVLQIRFSDDRTGKEGRGGPPVCEGQVGGVRILGINDAPPALASPPVPKPGSSP